MPGRLQLSNIQDKIDSAIRIFLYILIFWLPYSPAVIEVCVTVSLFLWIVKRSILVFLQYKQKGRPSIRALISLFRPVRTVLDLPIVLFLFLCFISALFSTIRGVSLHSYFSKIVEWFVVYYLFLEVIKRKRHLDILFTVLLITTLGVCVDGFIQFYWTGKDIFFGNKLVSGRATASFKHANGLGGYLAVTLPFILVRLRMSKGKGQKLLLLGACILCGWTLAITFSRGAVIASVIGTFLLFYYLRSKWFYGLLGGIVICAVCFSLVVSKDVKLKTRLSGGNIGATAQWRARTWEESLRMIKDKPLLGHGPNTFMSLFQEYREKPKYRGKPVKHHDYNPTYAHNCYIQMIAEVGVLGFLCFCWIIYRLLKEVRGYVASHKKMDSSAITCIGLVSGVVIFLIHSFIDTNFYSLKLSVYFWLLVGILISISQNGENFISNNTKINKGLSS